MSPRSELCGGVENRGGRDGGFEHLTNVPGPTFTSLSGGESERSRRVFSWESGAGWRLSVPRSTLCSGLLSARLFPKPCARPPSLTVYFSYVPRLKLTPLRYPNKDRAHLTQLTIHKKTSTLTYIPTSMFSPFLYQFEHLCYVSYDWPI